MSEDRVLTSIGYVEAAEPTRPRVVIVGATASQRATLNGMLPDMIFIDEFADIDVKRLDIVDCQLSGSFIVSDEDQKKLVELLGKLQEGHKLTACELVTPWRVRGDHRDQPKRGKKGKFKKDWQR